MKKIILPILIILISTPSVFGYTHKGSLKLRNWWPDTGENGPNQAINFEAQHTFKKGVLITNCKISFKADVQLIDVAIATTNTSDDSIDGSAKVTLGLDDNCADGGGAQLVTKGGVKLAAAMEAYGAQILALKDVIFAAEANGVEGISIVAGGEIDSTSGIKMAFCNGAGMGNNFLAEYFRMAI